MTALRGAALLALAAHATGPRPPAQCVVATEPCPGNCSAGFEWSAAPSGCAECTEGQYSAGGGAACRTCPPTLWPNENRSACECEL